MDLPLKGVFPVVNRWAESPHDLSPTPLLQVGVAEFKVVVAEETAMCGERRRVNTCEHKML